MKSIGLIGGISWHATVKYYSYINQAINNHFGDNTNPPIMIYNVNQSKMHQLQKKGDWLAISEMILEAGKKLQKSGADLLLICSNTTHKVFPVIQNKLSVPLLHIGEAVANHVLKSGLSTVGFLGTIFGMNDPFLTDHIRSFGINVLVPETIEVREELHRIIHEELTYNNVLPKSKQFILDTMNNLRSKGAQGIILGCTEYSLVFENTDIDFPVLDSVSIHAHQAVTHILSEIQIPQTANSY